MRKGTTHSDVTRRKISEALVNRNLSGNDGSFKPNHIPWNKEKEGIHLSPKTEWKAGDTAGAKSPVWKGGVQHIKNDCVYLWDGANRRLRRPRAVYEEAHGKGSLGPNHVIYHIDGNKNNDSPDNLRAITRAELMRLNHINKK